MTTIAPPPPAPASPPPLTPGNRTAVRVLLVIAAAAVVISTVVALGVTSWGLSTLRVVADEKALPADTTALVIDIGDVPAAVRITADRDGGEPRVRMRLLNSSRAGDHNLTLTDEAGTARLVVDGAPSPFTGWARSPLGDWDSAGEVNVILPPELARRMSITVRQQRGMVFTQTDVDELVVDSAHGDVLLGGGARRVQIRTEDGDVSTREPTSVTESFMVDSSDGDVDAEFRDAAPRRVDVTTRDGDVAMSLPRPGPYLVNASGGSTQVEVPRTNDPARAAATVTVRSDTGDVTVNGLSRG